MNHPVVGRDLTTRRAIRDLKECLSSVCSASSSSKKLPSLKEMWKCGDLRKKMVAATSVVASIRNRWQVRGSPALRMDCADHNHDQMRLKVCTLASVATLFDGQVEMMDRLNKIASMVQQGAVRHCSDTLEIHSQVEPPGFNSQTTRVGPNHDRRCTLTGTILRSLPIRLKVSSSFTFYRRMPPCHTIGLSSGSRNTGGSLSPTPIP